MSQNIPHKKNRNIIRSRESFTIIEVLTSVFIVAILITMLSTVLNLGVKAYRQADEIMEITNRAQRFMGQISAELSGAIVSSQNPTIPFQGTQTSIYFMAPWENNSNIELCEIGYSLAGNEIMKHFLTSESEMGFEYPQQNVNYGDKNEQGIIEGVRSLTFSYIPAQDWSNSTTLPRIVEIEVRMLDSRQKEYIFTTRVFIPASMNA